MNITFRYLIAFVLTCVMACAHAEEIPPRTLTTSGVGLVTAQADSIKIVMQATSTQKSAAQAKQEVDERINRLIHTLISMDIEKSQIVASSLRLNPQYDYNNRSKTFAGFSASRDISIELANLDKLNPVLQAAVDAGIDNINQLQPQNREQEQLQQQAFEAAIADSKAKASTLAKAYGAELGAIYSINYMGSQPMIQPKAEMAATMRLAADSAGGEYLHDELTYRDYIQVVYELIIPH